MSRRGQRPTYVLRWCIAVLSTSVVASCATSDGIEPAGPSASAGAGSGGDGGGVETTTSTSSASGSAVTTGASTATVGASSGSSSGAGDGGAGGVGGGEEIEPPASGTEIVSAGERSVSPRFTLVHTLGQSTQNQGKMSSPRFRLQGGLSGTNGSLP